MKVNCWALCALALAVVIGSGCGRMRARKPQEGEAAAKGGAAHGVAIEIDERIDGSPVASPLAEAEIAAALKHAGVDVVVKGNPERIVRGTAEAKLSGQKVVYGITTVAYEAVVTVKVIDARNVDQVESISTRARKTGLGADGAARDALKEAGAEAGRKIVEALKPPRKSAK